MTRRNGFTLLEMLVVLVVLGLMAALAAAHGPPRSAALDARAAASEIAGVLREARASAIARNQPVLVAIDPAARRFGVPGRPPIQVPPDVSLALRVPGMEGVRTGIAFAPDGSSSGGEVGVAGPSRRFVVGVNWLTGRVSVAEAAAP